MCKKVDIIMGIYNCDKYLSQSISSLLNQTFKSWRLIMCDDGSSDNTYNIALEYSKKYSNKILLLKNDKNMGLNYTLNKCLEYSDAKYIARMDGDDLCSLDRLEKEYNFLEKNSEYAFVSSNMILFDENGEWGSVKNVEKPKNIDFVKGSPFSHASVMIRSDAIKLVEGYSVDDKLLRVEDYHLWFKLYAKGYKGYNIQENLYKMRDDKNASNRRTWKNRMNEYYVRKIGYKMLSIPWYYRIYKYRPIILGLMPKPIYEILHKNKLKNMGE